MNHSRSPPTTHSFNQGNRFSTAIALKSMTDVSDVALCIKKHTYLYALQTSVAVREFRLLDKFVGCILRNAEFRIVALKKIYFLKPKLMTPTIALLAELPETLHSALTQYVEKHPDWDQDRAIAAALSLFLKQSPAEAVTQGVYGDIPIAI
jgi:Protein of unknown function (DUF2811)